MPRSRLTGVIVAATAVAAITGLIYPLKHVAPVETLSQCPSCFDHAVQVVNPGYVRTELTAGNRYPMPFLMECDEASRRICDGLARGGFEIRFPLRFAALVRLIQSLPYPLFFALFRKLGLR